MRAKYANIACMNFTKKIKSIQHARELNSQKILESPVVDVRTIERIFDNFFDFLIHEEGREISKENLGETRRMREAIEKAVFTDNHSCYKIWKNLDSIFKENQWTFDALEYLEIYLASQKNCLLMYVREKAVFNVFNYIISTLAELSNGDREVFLKIIKEYNNLPVFKIDFTKEDLHIKTVDKKRDFVHQVFLKNFNPKIPLEIWINIYFEASKDEGNIFAQEFQTKPYIAFLRELDKMQTTCKQKECTQVLT